MLWSVQLDLFLHPVILYTLLRLHLYRWRFVWDEEWILVFLLSNIFFA